MPRESTVAAQEALRKAFERRSTRLRNRDDDELVEPVMEQVPAQEIPTEGGLMEATFNKSLQQLVAALGGKASITSGKRSPERQRQLWEQALRKYGDPEIADNWVARPGGSMHEHGLAADLKFADEVSRAEAHRIAEQYGLWFPMAHEPWHVESVSTRRRRGKA